MIAISSCYLILIFTSGSNSIDLHGTTATVSRDATDEVIGSSFQGYPVVSSSVHLRTRRHCASRVCRCGWDANHVVDCRAVPEIYGTVEPYSKFFFIEMESVLI